MKKRLIFLIMFLIIIGVIIAGLIISSNSKRSDEIKNIDYYTCGMHPEVKVKPEDYKPGETKCPICVMDLVPVYRQMEESNHASHKGHTSSEEHKVAEKKVLSIKISPRQMVLANVQTEKVRAHHIKRILRASGTIEYDETKIGYVSSYINGRIDKLFVNFTGASVYRGQELATIYSPELISTQEEFLVSLKNARKFPENKIFQSLLQSSKERLKLWNISDKEIQEIEESGSAKTQMTIVSPQKGIVIHKNVIEGQYVKEGTQLYHIVDLSTVWMQADIFEYEMVYIKKGLNVIIESIAYPGIQFSGKITFIDPVLNLKTRSIKVRVEIPNYNLKLKPGMFVTAKIVSSLGKRKAIPRRALIDTGFKKVVYIKLRNESHGTLFTPRQVKTGVSDDNYIEILAGLNYGEEVVTTASFLLDSQAELTGIESAEYGGALDVKK